MSAPDKKPAVCRRCAHTAARVTCGRCGRICCTHLVIRHEAQVLICGPCNLANYNERRKAVVRS